MADQGATGRDACPVRNQDAVTDRRMAPARPTPCAECPFLAANHGREHDKGIYSPEMFTRVWRDATHDGGSFGCHKFDGDAYLFDDADAEKGFAKPVDVGHKIECAGMVALLDREMDRLEEAGSHEAYLEAHPAGLRRSAVEWMQARRRGEYEPVIRTPRVDPQDLVEPGEIVQDSLVWRLGEKNALNAIARIRAILPQTPDNCACPVCSGHAQVHPMATIRASWGGDVEVDQGLATLLSRLARRGVPTLESCIDFHEAVSALNPPKLAPLMNATSTTITYREPLRRRGAFVRFSTHYPAGDAWLRLLRSTDYGRDRWCIETDGPVAQVTFPPKDVRELEELALVLPIERRTRGTRDIDTVVAELERRVASRRGGSGS